MTLPKHHKPQRKDIKLNKHSFGVCDYGENQQTSIITLNKPNKFTKTRQPAMDSRGNRCNVLHSQTPKSLEICAPTWIDLQILSTPIFHPPQETESWISRDLSSWETKSWPTIQETGESVKAKRNAARISAKRDYTGQLARDFLHQ